MKRLMGVILILFGVQAGFSQGTLVWDWTWARTNDASDVGSGRLITGPDNGGGHFIVLDATGNIHGYDVVGLSGNVYGFIPQQWLGYPLGTSGGTNFTQFVFALSQGCFEMIQVAQEVTIDLGPPFGVLHTPASAVSSFWDTQGVATMDSGIFFITPEATPEPRVNILIIVGFIFFLFFQSKKKASQRPPAKPEGFLLD